MDMYNMYNMYIYVHFPAKWGLSAPAWTTHSRQLIAYNAAGFMFLLSLLLHELPFISSVISDERRLW